MTTYLEVRFLSGLLLPLVGALFVHLPPLRKRAWGFGWGVVGLTLLMQGSLLLQHHSDNWRTLGQGLFYWDALNGILSFFLCVCVFTVFWVTPKGERSPSRIRFLLLALTFPLLFFHANSLWLLLLVWGLSIALEHHHLSQSRLYLLAQVLALVLFCGAIWLDRGRLGSFSTAQWLTANPSLSPSLTSLWVLIAVSIAGCIRQGLFPFHGAFRTNASRNSIGAFLPVALSNVGLYLIVRYALPYVSPELSGSVHLWVIFILAFLALSLLVVDNTHELFASLVGIQCALVWLGYLQFDGEGGTGALIQWSVAILAGTGFGLSIWLFEVRTGVTRMRSSTVPFDKLPRVATLFLLFGMAMVDFPGTLGFVSEDLLIHSILEDSLLAGIVILVAMALVSITIYKGYVTLFLGRRLKASSLLTDLVPREGIAFLFLIALLVGLGIYPDPLLRAAGVLELPTAHHVDKGDGSSSHTAPSLRLGVRAVGEAM